MRKFIKNTRTELNAVGRVGQVVAENEIFEAIKRERQYQKKKGGLNNEYDVPGWILIMRQELKEAEEIWVDNRGNIYALRKILQVIAVGVACLEQWGFFEREYILKD